MIAVNAATLFPSFRVPMLFRRAFFVPVSTRLAR